MIIASEEIINALFGYGSFTVENIFLTGLALKYFGYGIPAFALIKILSNFFFARNNTRTPFYISSFIVFVNVIISISLFNKIGFVIIPIATSVSTWIGVIIYIFLLHKRNFFLLLQNYLIKNITKIILSSILMSLILIFMLSFFEDYLDYYYNYKAAYVLIIVSLVAVFYLISCYLSGMLKEKILKQIKMSKKKLVFSGVQPTGNLHLGNYLGALKNFVILQNEMECIYCVVDLHAITVFQDPDILKNNILETTAGFLAAGLDESKSIIFNQSSVSGHSELAWILNCVSRVGWLNRMTNLKIKLVRIKRKLAWVYTFILI